MAMLTNVSVSLGLVVCMASSISAQGRRPGVTPTPAELSGEWQRHRLALPMSPLVTHEVVAHVEDLALDAEAEGRGLARGLMEAVEAWARGRGRRRVSLNVWAQNRRAIGLYERLGYQPETVHYLKDVGLTP